MVGQIKSQSSHFPPREKPEAIDSYRVFDTSFIAWASSCKVLVEAFDFGSMN